MYSIETKEGQQVLPPQSGHAPQPGDIVTDGNSRWTILCDKAPRKRVLTAEGMKNVAVVLAAETPTPEEVDSIIRDQQENERERSVRSILEAIAHLERAHAALTGKQRT